MKWKEGEDMTDFNSHPHEEDDGYLRYLKNESRISTHILTKRMTKDYLSMCEACCISTHILTKRMTAYMSRVSISEDISTHILTKRMTEAIMQSIEMINISTHILTKRMTLSPRHSAEVTIFQLTSSRRG